MTIFNTFISYDAIQAIIIVSGLILCFTVLLLEVIGNENLWGN